jgi:hypothetical protein
MPTKRQMRLTAISILNGADATRHRRCGRAALCAKRDIDCAFTARQRLNAAAPPCRFVLNEPRPSAFLSGAQHWGKT